MKKWLLLFFYSCIVATSFGQLLQPLDLLKRQLDIERPASFDSTQSGFDLYSKEGLNYLYPVYQFLLNSKALATAMGTERFYNTAAQFISFTGDYKNAQRFVTNVRDTLSKRQKKAVEEKAKAFDGLQNRDARQYVLKRAKSYNILLINEAHDNPSHRAFTFSLLEGLYKQGYRYLAMETFNNTSKHTLDKVTSFTGFYTCESIGGELVRHALQLGYKLVSYEDTLHLPHRTSTERDSAQAQHIYEVLQQDSAAKILVHAGYGHIIKRKIDDYVSLGAALQSITHTPCLIIDQTTFSEGSFLPYENETYRRFITKYPISKPSVAFKNERLAPIFDTSLYDVGIIHPMTTYIDERPVWASLNGYKKKYIIRSRQITHNTFLVQAYYESEVKNGDFSHLVPADQTYYKTTKGDIMLLLRKSDYVIVYRDPQYRIIKR